MIVVAMDGFVGGVREETAMGGRLVLKMRSHRGNFSTCTWRENNRKHH